MANYDNWLGMTAYDNTSNKIGTIVDLYLDVESEKAQWITIKSGIFGSKVNFAPVDGATENEDGIVLSVSEEQIKNAPTVENDEEISDEEVQALSAYYFNDSHFETNIADEGHDASGPDTDDAMTRSEEQLNVGKRVEETGRMKLRKYVVVEDVNMTVPVAHEEVRLEREPITDDNREAAMNGGDITEEEHEIVLTAEVPVVEKKVVPIERVKVSKEVVEGETEINDQVRKEQIDLDQSSKR